MASEAVIIQEPISIVEKLAAEAVIIAEPISLAKSEEESKNLTFEVSTNNNGVEMENIIFEGKPEISKGESFLISPEISMVANETTKMLEHIEVDGSAFKAEKIPEHEEKMVIRNEEKDGTQDATRKDDVNYGSEEIKERCSMDSHDPIVEILKDANETVSDAGNSDRVQEDTLAKRVAESEGIASIHEPEVDEKLEEVSSEEIKCIDGDVQDENLFHTSAVVETKASDIRTENAVEECSMEATGRSEMNENTDQDFGMSGELCKYYANSELENVVVDMIQVAYKEPAMTDPSDEMKRDEESAVAAPEGDIIEPEPEPVSILYEKPVSPINVVYEDVDTTISSGTAETSTSIEGATSSKDCEESSDREGRGPMVVKEASNSKVEETNSIEETEKPDKDPSPFDVKESKEEIIPVELKEELARSSSFEPEESGKDTEEETNTKEDEALGDKDEITNVDAIEEIGIATTEHEGIGVEGANIDVNSTVSTVTCEKNVEILEPREEDRMQVEILNAGSEDEIPLKEVLGDEVKEHSTVPSEEYETIEERRLTETSEKDQDSFEHSEKVAEDVIPNTDTESAVTKAVDEIKVHEESTVLIPEGSITEAGNIGLVGQSGEEILESFQKMNEPENEKPACPSNVVSEDVGTAETSATIEEATSIEDHEERSEGEVREDSPAHHLQIEVNENKKTVEVEITNQNAYDLQVIVSSVGQPAENEQGMQFELPDVSSEERVHEAIGASKEKEEDSEDVSEACKSSDSINPEQIFTEAAATTDSKPETSKMDNENLMFVEEVYLLDSEQCSESNEALENKEDRIQQELEECTEEKLELKDAVENIEDNSKHEETKEVVEKLESDNTVEIAEKRILEDEDTKNQITLKEVSGSETAASGTEKEEIKSVEKELVHSSSLELEESKKDTEEETTVKECIETADLDCTSQAAESEETNLKEVKAEAEGEEEKNEINNVIECKDNVIGIESANNDVKSADSYVLSEKDIEISREEYVMQDKIQNAGSEDQMEMTIEDIPLKEVLGDEMKEISTMPSEDYEGTLIEETIVVDGTLEEDQALNKHSEDVTVDVQPVENEALEHKEEGIMRELKDCSAEKPEPKDAVENTEDNSKLEETNEVLEDPKSIIKEACSIIDDSLKSTEIMKEESKEENTAAMVSITETSNSIIEEKDFIEETAKSDNDPSLFDVAKESKEEITPIEVKEDHVHSSLLELDESRNLIEEEISEAEMEETNVKEAEAETEEEKNEINDDAVVEENSVERTEHEEIGIISAEIEVKSVDSCITGEKDMAIPEEHFPKAESEDTGNEIGHEVEEQLAEESNVEVTNVSSGEENRELENQTDACEAKTLQDETSSDLGREREKIEDGKPLDEAIDLEETSSTCNDDEKAIEEENLAKNLENKESLKEEIEIENQDHIPEMVIMTDNAKVGDYSSVSTECLKETESEEQIVAENLEVEEHSINDGEASHVTKAVEETRQDKESGDPISVHCEDREAEEKIEEIITDSKLCHDEGCIGAVTVVSAETSLNDTEKIVNASNVTPVETSLENIESDANQETEVENVQLAEISSQLDLDVQTKDNDEVQKQNLNMETVDKDEAEVIQRVPDAFYMLEVRVPEAEKGLIAETMDGLNRDHELVVMKNEASKNADELSKIDDIGSPNTVLGVKPEEQIQTSACTLLSDDEEIGTGNPVEKIEEETQKDDEIKHESQEDSSETMTIDEVCLSEKREFEAVLEEETIADQFPLHDKPEEKTETASSTLPSKESEHGTRAISEEIEYRTTEELPTEVDVVTGDEVTGEQTLSDNKPEEGTTSTPLVSEKDGEGNINTVEKEEEEKIYEADMIPNKISEDISVVETTAACLEEEVLELDGGKRDAAEKEDEKTNEAEVIEDENEEDALDAKTTLEICSKTERSIELEAVAEDEVAADETLTEKISDEEVQNPISALPSKEEECESTITAEMIESGKTPDDNREDEYFHKDCLREDEVLVVYETASSQVNPTEKPEDLPNPVDTLPTDQLHLTTSMLSSEVQGDERMGSELKEDESPEKIPEQTREIEEAYDFNTEIHEKDFDNELLDGKDDAAIQDKLVKSGTETGETIPNEVSTEKAIMEDKTASEKENPIVDHTVEHPGQASAARIETTAVTEENVEPALAGLEEKPESDLEPVAEDRSEKTIAEHIEIEDAETSIGIQYQETEEPIKEPKDKLEAEDNINGEESTNEVTKAAILSEVVDKEVGIEDTKEQVMEEKSGTNELRPISKGDESTDELEDYSVERIEEVKLEEKIDYIGSPNTVLEVKPEEHIKTLISEDEQIGTANPVEKIEEEKQKDAEIVHDSREVPSETKTTEEACLSNEGQKELKAVSEEETSADQVPLNDEPEEQNQTTPSTLQLEESEHGTGARSEETENGKTKEELPAKLDIVTGDEVTGEQALSDNKPEEGTTSTPLVSEKDGEESIQTVENTEEENLYEGDMIADNISEDLSVVETMAEVCLEKEELLELDDRKKDDAEKENEKTNEAEIIRDEIEEDAKDSSTTLETCSQTERSIVLEAVAEDEMTAGEKEDEKTNEAEIIRDEIEEDAKDTKTTLETCSQTERSIVLEAVADDEITAGETLAEKTSDEVKNPTYALPLKEEESESTITDEMLEAVAEDENASSPAEKHKDLLKPVDTLPTDQLHLTTSMLPSEVQGDERKETELNEDESPEKIAEQTMEIEEASGLNTEIHEKAFDNELPDETEDAAIKEKLVKAATETTEIILNEVSTEKVIMESHTTNENENLSEDKSVDDLGQALVAKIDTTAVTKENVELAPAGFEEKPESNLEPLSEDQSKETITEHAESQDDETNIDIQNQETEEQIKEELKDNPETDVSINEEENSNEVTEAVILSEEVDKEVEKADCIEDIKEHVMEEESSTNGLHPISKGDEANNEVGDYRAVSTERIEKVEFEEQIEAQNTEVEENSTEDKQGSHVTIELDEGRQEEEFGHPLMVCGEDREKEEIEGIIDDSKLRQDGTHIEAVTEERAETSLNEELVYTSNISSVKMNLETIKSDANQKTEVIEKVQLEVMSSNLAPQVRTNDNDEEEVIKRDPDASYIAKDHIAEAESGPIAALEVDKVEETEGVPETSSHYTSERIETALKDDISSTNTLPEEKLEQLQISPRTLLSEDEEVQKDTEIKHEILEDSFDTETIEEVCLPNEEQGELKAVSEEEIIADKGLPNDEPEEQIQTTPSALPSNESDYRTGGMSEETAINLDVVTGDEKTGEQTLKTNKPEEETTSSPLVSMEEEEPESSFEKIEEEKLSEADIPDKNSEDFSDGMKTAETCSEKQVFQELDDATEDETAAQALQVQESYEKSLTSELPVENLKHGAETNEEEEEENVKEVEMLEKEGPRQPEAVVDPETILARASIAEESQEIETIVIVENLDEENREAKDGTTLLSEKMNEESKEDNTAKMVSITEASNSIIEETVSIEETEKSSNDTILFDIEKEMKEEITPIEVKEDHVHSSSFELEESKNVIEEETSVAETEEINIKEAEKEEERNETNDDAVVVEENRVERTEHEDISVCSAENDVKSVDSYITPQQDSLEKPESLKKDIEIEKYQIPDIVIINENAKVEEDSLVSPECLTEAESEEQIVAENLHVEENSTNDREAFYVTKEFEETRQDEESVDPVSVDSEDREAEEKTEIIVDSSMCYYESCIEAITDVSAVASLNDNNDIVTAPDIRSIETSRENIETDAKQETEVEDVQLEEMSSELDSDVQTNYNGVDAALQQEPLKEDEALVVHDIDNASSQAIQTEKPDERIQNPAVTLPSEEHRHAPVDDVDKTGEIKDGDSDGGKTVKDKTREPAAMLEGEMHTSHIIAEESEEHKAVTAENKIEEAEPFEDRKIPQSEDGAAAVHIFPENETKETELTEDKSLENIQEQTREIEEASNVNKTCEKAFDNELLTETADAPNEKKIVTARDETEDEGSRCKKMNEGDEITVNEVSNEEVMEGKEVTETSYSTSLSEEKIEDGSGDDEQKDKPIKDNTYKENVEPESVLEVVAEERIRETLPELTNDQDDETSIDVRNQETEELIKYELKDEDSAIKEENTNEATEAAILSEKVDDSEDIIENVIEEERSTNELHPVSKGDEATNEVEDYSAVSTECIKEAESMEQIDAENSEVINTLNISSVKMSLETIESGTKQKTEEVEKVQLEEISSGLAPEVPTNENDEAEVLDRGIEAFYMAKNQIAETENGTTEELEAYDVKETEGETETSVDYTSERVKIILKDDIRSTNTSPEETPEEQLQSSTSTLLLEDEHIRIEYPIEKIEEETHGDAEIKHVTPEVSFETKRIEDACFPSEQQRELEAISKEETIATQGLPNDEPEEEIQTTSSTLPSEENEQGSRAISEEITPEQSLEKNEPEEGTTISLLDPKEMEEENICTIEKTEEELNKLDMIPDKISEHLEDAIKDETTVAQASEAEESNEQSLTPELTVENIKHGAMANDEEDEEVSEVKMREREISLEKEGPQKLEAVVDQETIVSWASIPEEPHKIEGISIVEKLDEEKIKGDENLNNDNCEGSSAGVTEELNELKLVTKEEITSSDQIFPEEQLHISSSAITSEELEYEPKETEDEKKRKREIEKDEIVKDASDASTTVEICSLKGSFVVLEVVSENEMTARMAEKTESEKIDEAEFLQDDNRKDVTLQKELYQENDVPAVEEQILSPVVLPSEEQKLETINEVNKTEEDHMKEKEMENGGFDGVKPVEEISTEKDEMKEAEPVLEGETNHLHITTSALPSEVQGDETNESESKEDESPEKMREQTGEIEEASNSKTDTCEKALDNELLAETEDAAIKENPLKVNDITLNKVSTEKVVKSKEVTETSCSTSCSEMLMKDVSTEDEVKYKPVEGKTYEENVEPELAGFEEKPKSDSESVAEDQSKETIPEVTKNQDDETRTDVWNQETEEQIKEELKDEDYINREENANGVTKAIISSEKIDKEVEKADGSEDLKEHVIEKETSTNELHLVSREDETNNEVISVEDCSSVLTECIKEAESEEQIEAENSEVEENSTNDKKVSHVTKALEEKSQAEESRDPVYVHAEHREAEEKVEITDDLKLDESNIEAAAEVRAETSLNSAEVKEHVNTSNISSAKMSLDTIETDANQETDEVEKVQLEEIFSDLAPKIPNNDSDEVELIKRDPDVFYMHEDKVENGSTAELEADKVEETEGVPETSSDCISQRIQTILIDDISSTNTIPEGKPDERPQSSACTLLSENEEIGIAKPVEKIEEEIRNIAKTMEKVCLPEEANLELEAVLEEETTADKVLPNDEPEEKIQTAYLTLPSEERDLDVVQGNEVTSEQNLETSSRLVSMEDEEIVSSIEKIEEGNINEVDIPEKTSQDFSVAEKMLEICLEKDEFQELDHAKKEETAAPQAIQLEESNEQSLILESLVENPNHGAEADEEEKKVEEVEILEKEGLKEPEAVVNQETVVSQASITERSQKIEAIGIVEKLEEEKMKEAEKLNNGNREDSLAEETEKLNELHLVTKEEIIAGQSFSEQLHISASAITSELLEHETKDKEAKKTSKGEVIKDETKEDATDAGKTVEVCSQMERSVEPEAVAENKMTAGTIEKVESEKTEDAEFLNIAELQEDGSHEKIQDETGEIEEASNFNMGIHEKAFHNELLNETEDSAIKENLVKARDEPGCEGNQCEKTNEGNEIILSEVSENVASYSTSHLEDPTKDGFGEDALKDELIEDNTYEELIVEARKTSKNEIIEKHMEDRVVEDQGLASVVVIETTTESGTKISAAEGNEILDNIQQTEETTKTASDMQIPRELDPIENTGITSSVAKQHVSIELQDRVAESSQKAEVGDVGEIYPGVECVREKTDEEVTEGYVMVEDSTKFSSYDPLESFTKESLQVTRGMIEREVKDETNASQVPLVEKTEKESPAPVDDIEKKELKEVETQNKGFSDTKSGGEISYVEEEKKELKVAVEQETIAIQAPQTKIKDDPVSHFEVSGKEDEHTGDKTNETLKVATCEIQNEKPFEETQKDDANDNIKTVAEDQTVNGDMNEAAIVKEEITGKEEPIESEKTTNSTGKQQLLTEQQTIVGDFEPGNDQETCSEAGADNGEGKRPDNLGAEKSEGPEPVDSAKLSLYDLLQRSTRKTIQGTENVIEDRELIVSNEQAPEEEAKTDEEEGDEHNRIESSSKPHKKSHNILSGVGSKVKQSISKVKKAITGKSSHPKEPKPISPKESKK